MERVEDAALGRCDRIGQLTMRNLDIADSRSRLEQYAGLGMVGSGHPALPGANTIGAAQAASPGLIAAGDTGAAAAIASGGNGVGEDELLDRAAMEAGTD